MKIKEFHIIRYGPLRYGNPVEPAQFTLFSGNNEDGKTLTIDAIVKLLFGSKVRDFKKIERVGENPEGYLVLETDNGAEVKLPEHGDLTELTGLGPAECANIFIIRNSDLGIPDESGFYAAITDRLTGMRIEDIRAIKEALYREAKLTPGGTFRDLKGEKLKSRIERGQSLLKDVDELIKQCEAESLDLMIEELVGEREKLSLIEYDMKKLEEARVRDKYEQGKAALEAYGEALAELRRLDEYREEEEKLWRAQEHEIERLTEEKKGLRDQLSEREERHENTRGRLAEEEGVFNNLREKKVQIDERVMPLVRNHEELKNEVEGNLVKKRFITFLWILSAVLSGLALSGFILLPSIVLLILLFFASLAAFGVFSVLKYVFVRQKAKLARLFTAIRNELSRFGLQSESIEGTRANIQSFEEEVSRRTGLLEQLRMDMKLEEKIIDELRNVRLPDLSLKMESAHGKINDIKRNSGETTLAGYARNLTSKAECSSTLKQQANVLVSLFGGGEKGSDEDVKCWKQGVSELEEFAGRAAGVSFSEKLYNRVKEDQKLAAQKIREIEDKLSRFAAELLGIEREANEILQLEGDYINCKTLLDLLVVKNRLQEFLRQNEQVRSFTLEALGIIEEIESEEKARVSELFGYKSPVSGTFSDITAGRYREVRFDQKSGEIEVIDRDEKTLGASRLSAGAYDQLYLSIRLSLGQKLLKGGNGFFVLDDPFIKADAARLKKQIDILLRIAGWGWQILYFSAKDEVRKCLKKQIDEGAVRCINLPGVT